MISHILIAWDRMRWLNDPLKGRIPGFVCCCATWLTGMVIALPYPIYTIYVELGVSIRPVYLSVCVWGAPSQCVAILKITRHVLCPLCHSSSFSLSLSLLLYLPRSKGSHQTVKAFRSATRRSQLQSRLSHSVCRVPVSHAYLWAQVMGVLSCTWHLHIPFNIMQFFIHATIKFSRRTKCGQRDCSIPSDCVS